MKTAGPLVHGTRQGYKRKCRCEECRAANADYTRAWRKRKRERETQAVIDAGASEAISEIERAWRLS